MTRTDAETVLIVDDDPIIRRLVRHGLRGLGLAEILEAPGGREAQALLREREVDLVITDLLMPDLDGLGLIRWANEHCPGPVWIILSGVDTFDAAVEAIQVGAFHFLSKPLRYQELEVSVRNALAHRRLLRERERLFAELEAANRQLVRQVRELEHKSEIIRRDLRRAEVIQRALLPAEPPSLERHRVTALYRPGRHVGGDLYHVARIGARHLMLYVADATGHGVSSAMLSVLFHRRLEVADEAGEPLAPAVSLERVNRALCADRIVPGLFLTAAFCLLDLESGELRVAAAGHPPVLLRRAGGETLRLDRTGPALGLVAGAQYGEERVRLDAGDRLLLFTDGLLGDASPDAACQALADALGSTGRESLALLEHLLASVRGGADAGDAAAADPDDATALLLEASPGPSRFDNGAAAARPAAAAAPARPPDKAAVRYGESAEQCVLAVRGRGTWMESEAFLDTARGILDAGRPLVVDLSECSYLDSTFLGTIHELVAGDSGARLHLQGVQGAVRQAFEELSMDGVLGAARKPTLPLPRELQPLAAGSTPGPESQRRILRAHEALASLSARNRDKFLAVVDTLREQLDGSEG